VTPRLTRTALAAAGFAVLAAGCSSLDISGDTIDYRSGATKTNPLEVPPNLTPLVQDARNAPQGGVISASSLNQPAATRAEGSGQTVAVQQLADIRVERAGDVRWLVVNRTPEQVWPIVRQFWLDRGFALTVDNPAAGVVETDWAENRAKLPQDVIRNTLGRVLDSFYSTGERDKFRTRLERTASGTEIYVSHRGLEEVFTDRSSGSTAWTARASDPALEAEMLSRLMVSLGSKTEAAHTAVAEVAPGVPAPARARVIEGEAAATLQMDDAVERAWRRVGLALDRTGFTVEDRDQTQGLYFVRYASPEAAKDSNFFTRLFTSDSADSQKALDRYRVQVKADGMTASRVTVLNADGAPDHSVVAQKIVTLLVDELK